jgi:hypothetical protein
MKLRTINQCVAFLLALKTVILFLNIGDNLIFRDLIKFLGLGHINTIGVGKYSLIYYLRAAILIMN